MGNTVFQGTSTEDRRFSLDFMQRQDGFLIKGRSTANACI